MLNHNVEGVYETKLPLIFRAIMDLGCLVKPRTAVIPRNEQALGHIYKIHELEVRAAHQVNSTGGESAYMPSSSYEKISLLHSSSGNRHFWGLFLDVSKDITFYVVNPAVANKQ